MAIYVTSTSTTTDDINFTDCTFDCNYCTLTCDRLLTNNAPLLICSYTDPPEPREKYFIEPTDYKLIKLRRKQLYQRTRSRSVHFPIPLLKRKLLVSASGWLTRKEYQKKKGHNKKP